MKLSDIGSKSKKAAINKITESRFGFAIDYSSLTPAKARSMMKVITESVNKVRHSSAIHTAERDPKYMEMLMVYEGLDDWLTEHQMLNEGEMGQAETILAAKDMVDSTQDMIERVGKMQNEQLPALIDSIRDQIGSMQADAFKTSVGQVFATLSQTLTSAREQLDSAARALSGDDTPPMDMGGGMTDPNAMGGQQGMPGQDPNAMGDDTFGAVDAAAGGTAALGREQR